MNIKDAWDGITFLAQHRQQILLFMVKVGAFCVQDTLYQVRDCVNQHERPFSCIDAMCLRLVKPPENSGNAESDDSDDKSALNITMRRGYDTDEEFAPSMERQGRNSLKSKRSKQSMRELDKLEHGQKTKSKRNGVKPLESGQRPRTDWQKRERNLWVKVVPPWWCEQRTVHFASMYF